MRKFGMSWIVGALALGAFACDDGAADTAENAGRCQRICNAVEKCTGDENDTASCRMECKDDSVNDAYEAKAKECSQCIERDNSCSQNVVKCAAECATVVTLSAS